MKRTAAILTAALFSLSLGGCLITTRDHGHSRHSSANKGKSCHPSQYWDGTKCKHKGKGKGARKHDGR
jgi:hypothetical protein